jgi:CheY-like chemotaxis protein
MGLNIVVAGGAAVRSDAQLYLTALGHRVRAVASGMETATECRLDPPDVVLCESRLSDGDGLLVAAALREGTPQIIALARRWDRARVRQLALPSVELPLTPLSLIAALVNACGAATDRPLRTSA